MAGIGDLHSTLVSVLRLGRGSTVSPARVQPVRMLELYEYEACPFCRKVRETLTELDVDWLCHPCARGSRHRETAIKLGGKTQFPLLFDPSTNTHLYESEDIITWLHATFGEPRNPISRQLAPANTFLSFAASGVRPRGRVVREDIKDRAEPAIPLELYTFEACPYCRKVRETLTELDITFVVHNVGHGSLKRQELIHRGGKFQVPYLVDPNTRREMYESDDIIQYLEEMYGPPKP